ncbi:DUF4124 domain-containing protein [Thalassotalea euphylliae]|uniref:DUF4124 domain-containing protein n=1 Tax=Thalassotalea euphylliae TaxID=1655234 RepID=UPI0036433099
MRKTLLTLSLLSFSAPLLAQSSTIYRWVDENNIVHFSHEHPDDKDYAVVDVQVSYAPIEPEEASEAEKFFAERQAQQEVADKASQIEKNAALIKQNCEAAKINLKILSGFERILYTDPDGNKRLLSNDEKQEQLALSKKHAEVYCESEEEDPNLFEGFSY